MNMRDLDTRAEAEAFIASRRKRGDWRSITGVYLTDEQQAREAADEFLARFPDRRVRIRYWSTLGYAVQTFVERSPR